ncbi:hypothetical protein J4480_05335 [Candidatus Woesearchaeota archaeon]|nr:hypothetical protein [Candidatus Woesearchaeota archaeon]
MEYWNEAITQKSWETLQKISKKIDFILIGGWAAYLWAKSHKSKDIDIVIGYKELDKLKLNYNLKKNDNLKKYEIIIDDLGIDIYVPFYSKLPLLESIDEYTSKIESFEVVNPEALLVLKQAAELDRGSSEKGLKDRIDIMDLLLKCQIDFKEYCNILAKHNLKDFKNKMLGIVSTFNETKYLGLNPREFKLKKLELIKNIKNS